MSVQAPGQHFRTLFYRKQLVMLNVHLCFYPSNRPGNTKLYKQKASINKGTSSLFKTAFINTSRTWLMECVQSSWYC